MANTIFKELRQHAPFTFLGALSGIIICLLLRNIPHGYAFKLFYVFHPLHVFLSAFVTAAMFKIYQKEAHWLKIVLIGLVGSIGVATVSDSIIPFIGETLLHLPDPELHIGFLEKWYIVNPIAVLGILLAMKFPTTRLPHMAHVFVSTWASLFHVMMALGVTVSFVLYAQITTLLFLAVWLPCCFSDIVFPLLFIKNGECEIHSGCCSCCKK